MNRRTLVSTSPTATIRANSSPAAAEAHEPNRRAVARRSRPSPGHPVTLAAYRLGVDLRTAEANALAADGQFARRAWLRRKPYGLSTTQVTALIALADFVEEYPETRARLQVAEFGEGFHGPASDRAQNDDRVLVRKPRMSFTLFPWLGGKARKQKPLHDRIVPLFAPGQERVFWEVCAGTAVTSLHLLDKDLVDRVFLNDINPAVSEFWTTVIQNPWGLIHRVRNWTLSDETIKTAFDAVRGGTVTGLDLAFDHLVVQWTSMRGHGLNQKNRVLAETVRKKGRWNPEEIIRRILFGHRLLKGRVIGNKCHSLDVAEVQKMPGDGVIFVDPPYIQTGGCYRHPFDEDRHRELAQLLRGLDRPWVLTYDDHPLVVELYEGFEQSVMEFAYPSKWAKGGKVPKKKERWITSGPMQADYRGAA